jgi:hypothetical protein
MNRSHAFGIRRAFAILCVFAATWACGGDGATAPPAPEPGQLTVNLATSGRGGAAFLVQVTGDSISNPTAANTNHKLYGSIEGNTLRLAVIGSAADGPLFRFHVPDVNAADGYAVTLEEVAGSDNQLRPTEDYTLTIAR